MKQILLSLTILFGIPLCSQTIDTIISIDTTIVSVDTVTTIDTVMLINKTDSSVLSIPILQIDSLTFNDTTNKYSHSYIYDTLVTYDTILSSSCDNITYNGYKYDLIDIGGQCWFKENLRTIKYKDNSPINNPGIDYTAWNNDTSGAFSWYLNDSLTYAHKYGALYNWHAVDNSAGLCPSGWSVPSDSDWILLETYLESNNYNYDSSTTGNKFAKAMSDTILWTCSQDSGAVGSINYSNFRNKSGFSALPGGTKSINHGKQANFWSSTAFNINYSWFRALTYSSDYMSRYYILKSKGLSVRCLKTGAQTYPQTIDTLENISITINIDTIINIDSVISINKKDSTVLHIPLLEVDTISFTIDTNTYYNYTYSYDTTITFDTLIGSNGPCKGLKSITYNNHTYELLEIGRRCWFKENLQTTMYRDSTPIFYPGSNNTLWNINTTGAYSWYANDSSNAANYGALYNWYAVDNPSGLCPSGWHVPNDCEWTNLDNYLENNGYNYDGSLTGNKYAKAMADTMFWLAHSDTGVVGNTDYPDYRNKSGFSARPGESRTPNGWSPNSTPEVHASFWSSSYHYTGPWSRKIIYLYSEVYKYNTDRNHGLSVRCIKD